MTLSEIRKSNLPYVEKKMYFYDRMLHLICLKQHNMDMYSEILVHYLYWKILATGGLSDPSNRLSREAIEYVTRMVTYRQIRLRVTDSMARAAKDKI